MELLENTMNLLNSGKYQETIDTITEFLDENPEYKTIDYYHFANPLEELLFNENIKEINTVKTLPLDEPLEEIYTIYAIAHMATGDMESGEKYLKTANQINPVSAPILMRLCEYYQNVHEEEKLKEPVCDIFKYAYEPELITSNYFKLADYLYHTNQNMELYDHLFNFFMFLKSDEEIKPVSEDVKYFKENNIQVGANPEVLMMLMYLIDVHTQQNMLGTAEYFKNIFNELAEYTKHLNHL